MKQVIYSGMFCRYSWHLTTAIPLLAALLVLAGCGDISNKDTEIFDPIKAAQHWNTADKTWNIDELKILENGKSLYKSRCSGCHQQAGTGSTTIGAPALKGSAVARGGTDILISTVLFGRGSMPAFRYSLDDAELAGILSYVRNAWGNDMRDVVQVSRVAEIRAGS